MKKFMLSLAVLGLLTLAGSAPAAEETFVTPTGTPIQTVGVARPWRGWGVARPYGAPLGYNRPYGVSPAYRGYNGAYGYNTYRPYRGYY